MSQLLGKALIKVDGQLLRSKPGAKFNLGGVTRKTQSDDTGHGFSEENVAPFIECSINLDGAIRISDLAKATSVSVTFEADTGQTYVLRNAWIENPPEVTSGEGGDVPLRYVGESAEEMA